MLVAALGTLLAGCREEPKNGFERYIPPSEAARAGVVHVMEGWLKGLSPGASGSAQAGDPRRRPDAPGRPETRPL